MHDVSPKYMRSKMGKTEKIIFFLMFCLFVPTVQSYSSDINPNIKIVTTGPVSTDYGPVKYRFRMVTLLREGRFSMHFERVEYGAGNCCLKIVNTFTIDPSLIKGKYQLNNAPNIKWLSYNSFNFKENSTLYSIKNIGGKYIVFRD